MVTVKNTFGDIQYDIAEFYLNDVPNTGNITITYVGEPYGSAGTTMNSLACVNLTGWYDTPDDTR